VGINGELRDVEFLVSQYALDGRADLPFVEHEGLRMEDAPAGQHMAIDTDGRSLSAWIEACLPNPLSGLQAHHIGGGQIRATPGRRDRMLPRESEHRGAGVCEASFVTGPAHRLPDAGRGELRHHARRLGRRHRGAMGQDAGIHHQQFLLRTRFATEHEPTKAHLGIDLEQQLRQLRLADPVIERGAQLDQFRLLLRSRQGRQMQLVVDA
jgi:hypothetical protein